MYQLFGEHWIRGKQNTLTECITLFMKLVREV